MRRVAAGARHPANLDGVDVGLVLVRPLLQVALVADLSLKIRLQHRVDRGMGIMAFTTVDVLHVMGAPRPVQSYVLVMACQASLIVLTGAGSTGMTPVRNRNPWLAFLRQLDVFTTRTMTGFAL